MRSQRDRSTGWAPSSGVAQQARANRYEKDTDDDDEDALDESAPLRRGGPPQSQPAPHGASMMMHPAVQHELGQQDAVLDALHSSVTRLAEISGAIHDEVQVQDKMLDELEESVSRTDSKVQEATRRTKDLIRRGGGARWCCLLAVLVAVLGALILYIVFG